MRLSVEVARLNIDTTQDGVDAEKWSLNSRRFDVGGMNCDTTLLDHVSTV